MDLEDILKSDEMHSISYSVLPQVRVKIPRTDIDAWISFSRSMNHPLIRFLDFLFVLIDNFTNRLALFISDLEEKINDKYLNKSKKKYNKIIKEKKND